MLCPKLKRVEHYYNGSGKIENTIEFPLECIKEKCAWWIDIHQKFSNGDKMKFPEGVIFGDCALKIIADNQNE